MGYRFCDNEQLNFEVLLALGAAYRQGADVGEVLSAATRVADGDPENWFTTWTRLARRVRERARRAGSEGRTVSAREAYLRAAGYFGTALAGVGAGDDPGRRGEVFAEHRECFERFGAAWEPAAEAVAIPFGNGSLPGYLFSPPGPSGALAVVIVNNGSDGPISSAWTLLGAGAVARGHRVLLFDGPGQQSMLFEQGVSFRPDWENVITPVVDFLLARDDIDPRRIALTGLSQAGYWVPRALAFEHRIAAAVVDPGVFDVSTAWWKNVPSDLRTLWESGDRTAFDRIMREELDADPRAAATWNRRAKPYGDFSSPFDLLTEVGAYTLAPVADRVTTPLLITDPEGESFWPGQSQQLYEALSGPRELLRFTEAEGAGLHCEPVGRALFEHRVFDWLDARLNTASADASRSAA